jgi:hypothetical protein
MQLAEWWRMATRRRRLPDGPRQRYDIQRRLGADDNSALITVALSYGLAANVVQLRGDGNRKSVELRWTLKQIAYLLELQWEVETGRAGGPNG